MTEEEGESESMMINSFEGLGGLCVELEERAVALGESSMTTISSSKFVSRSSPPIVLPSSPTEVMLDARLVLLLLSTLSDLVWLTMTSSAIVESPRDKTVDRGPSCDPFRGIASLGVGVRVDARELIDLLEGEGCNKSRRAEQGSGFLLLPSATSSSGSSSSSGELIAILPSPSHLLARGQGGSDECCVLTIACGCYKSRNYALMLPHRLPHKHTQSRVTK
jgi:hypothetical protein